MSSIEKVIEVEAPLRAVYDQWTRFEEFPRFMAGIQAVRRLDDKTLEWRAEILGQEKTWVAQILRQIPDERIVWRSTSGAWNGGMVQFVAISSTRTRVALRLEYEPTGVAENAASAMGLVSARISGDLKRFQEFLESRGAEQGAASGEIRGRELEA